MLNSISQFLPTENIEIEIDTKQCNSIQVAIFFTDSRIQYRPEVVGSVVPH